MMFISTFVVLLHKSNYPLWSSGFCRSDLESTNYEMDKKQPFRVLKSLLITKLQDFETILTERSHYGSHKNK